MAEDGPSSAERGRWAEDLACKHLIDHGLVLVTRNYRCRYGEIDLIMRDGRTIAFVEVRLRSRIDYGTGAESVDTRKQTRLIHCAEHYLQRHATVLAKCRFDVVSILERCDVHRLEWIRNAFTA